MIEDLVASFTNQKCWKCIGFSPVLDDSCGTQGHNQAIELYIVNSCCEAVNIASLGRVSTKHKSVPAA